MTGDFAIALNFFKNNDFLNAERIVEAHYKAGKAGEETVYLYALIKSRQGQFENAAALFREVLALNPKNAEGWYNLALACHNLNLTDDAVECYKNALNYNPFLAEAHNNLAILYKKLGNFELAEQEFLLAVKVKPGNQNAASNLGNLKQTNTISKELLQAKELYELKEYDRVLEILSEIHEKNGQAQDALNLRGMVYYEIKDYDSAIKAYESLLELNSRSDLAWYSLAVCYQAKCNYDKALRCYQKAVEINPEYLDALNNLGLLYVDLKKNEEAEKCYNKALDTDPEYYNTITNLGALKINTDRIQEGVDLFDRALSVALKLNDKMKIANAYGNIGFAKIRQLDLRNAVHYFNMTLELDPENMLAHYNKAEALLMLGEFFEGWLEYEWRTGRKDFGLRKFTKPLAADIDLKNKKVLVYAEQGIGDAIQFARYLPMLKAAGAYIIFECDRSVIEIMRSVKEIDELIERNLESAPEVDYDYDIPLLSLPRYFNTTLECVPDNVPYLEPAKEYSNKWERLIPPSDKLKIGIVWAGSPTHSNDRHRSIRLKQFLPLFSVPGTEFFSLQKGFPVIQLRDYQLFVTDLDSQINSFSDTAAAIGRLDLVIAVDTSVAHMAGALGKPVWLLIPYVPDWRWMLERNDSPWYPSMKLFRQPRVSDWGSVLTKVKDELNSLKKGRVTEMQMSNRSFNRLDNFLRKIEKETYPEPISPMHLEITERVLFSLLPKLNLPLSSEILDIGCGQGPALKIFKEKGYLPVGIALNDEDVHICTEKGYKVFKMDQSFMDFENDRFDLVWSRHCLEHSFAPYFTLSEYCRVTKPGGLVYIEIPAPDTDAHHETNPNHYSVLSKSMWLSLFNKVGLKVVSQTEIPLGMLDGGTDLYWAFICQREMNNEQSFSEPLSLTLALTSGENFGWGICSKYLRQELSKKISIINAEDAKPDSSGLVEGTVLHALTNQDLYPLHNIRGRRNFGYTFFESELTARSIENASRYDLVIGGSSFNRDKMLEKGITNVDYLIQGIDPELFYPGTGQKQSDLFVVFSGGKFELRKGQDIVLKAIGIMQQKYNDVILINAWYNLWPETMDSMAGSKFINYQRVGENWQQFMVNLLKINGIDGNKVFTLPLTPNDKMREVYLRTDVGLFPNRCEGGTNLVLMEYMACGKPVIASYNSGHKDILTDTNSLPLKKMNGLRLYGENKQVIANWEEPDIDEVVAKLEFAYHNRDSVMRTGNIAGEYMKQFSWENSAANLLRIIGR